MPQDTQYTPFPFIFKSTGIVARPATDRTPEFSYLNLQNAQEREEFAMSARYGSFIINRDPAGTINGQNYFLPHPPVSLTRLKTQVGSWRYSGDNTGALYRRAGDTQGPYAQIYTGLSGQPFSSIVNTTFGSSLPYLFIADATQMVKDSGTGSPTQWGIFAPNVTASTTVYAPQVFLIDGFDTDASGYAVAGITGWAAGTIGTVVVTGVPLPVNDFYSYTSVVSGLANAFDGVLATFGSGAGPSQIPIQTIFTDNDGDPGPPYPNMDVYTSAPHGLSSDQYTTISGNSNSAFNGTFLVDVLSPTEFLIAKHFTSFHSGAGGYCTSGASGGAGPQAVMFNIYASPYPNQFSAVGVGGPIDITKTNFVLEYIGGSIAASTQGAVFKGYAYDLSQRNQATSDDLIVLVMSVGTPGNIASASLRFDINSSLYTFAYYSHPITFGPAAGNNAWVTYYFRMGDFVANGQAGQYGFNWANITSWQLVITTNSGGSTTFNVNGLYQQWGYGPSSFGNGIGYDYRYTYLNNLTKTESNPCVTADTWVMTSQGPRLVKELVGNDFVARVNGCEYATRCGGFFSSGVKPVFELVTTDGFRLKATAEHEILKASRITTVLTETEWTPLDALKPGDKICLHNHRELCGWPGFGDEDDGYLIGLLVGDGHFNSANGHAIVQTFDADAGSDSMTEEVLRILRKKGVSSQFKGGHKTRRSTVIDAKYVRELATYLGLRPGDGNKTVTNDLERCSSAFYRGFLRGIFDADGTVTGKDSTRFILSFSQSDDHIIRSVQRMLLRLGIASNIFTKRKEGDYRLSFGSSESRIHHLKAAYTLTIGGDNADRFLAEVGFVHRKKSEKLKRMVSARKRAATKERFLATVKEIIPCGEEQVFDTKIPVVHFFDANGIAAHNCPIQYFSQQYGYVASLAPPLPLEQAFNVGGVYSTDPQVTHVQVYRRGGSLGTNWFFVDRFLNVTGGGAWSYKDILPDSQIGQSDPLVLTNDVPVTSSLEVPIATFLSAATTGPGTTPYNAFVPQTISMTDSTVVFVPGQIVDIGNPQNLEQVQVITGGTGSFTGIVRLIHDAGEPVYVFSIPGQPCDLCELAYGQIWLAGDKNNPHYLYYTNPGYPENISPANFIPVSEPSDPIMGIINFRGTLYAATLTTWYLIVGGASPYAQPTGSKHGLVAKHGYTQTESAIWYQAIDGIREFRGADGAYRSLWIEWLYRTVPQSYTPVPLVNLAAISNVVMAFVNNFVYVSYPTQLGTNSRIIYDTTYTRWRNDNINPTAMYFEEDTNLLLYSWLNSQPGAGGYAISQDQTGNFDDSGWVSGKLTSFPIEFMIQTPFQDLGKPHFTKQWNMLELDVNTMQEPLTVGAYFDEGGLVNLGTYTTAGRQKVQVPIPANSSPETGEGIEAYRMSLLFTGGGTNEPPIIYQCNIYAAVLAANRNTFDTYWIKFNSDESKLVKQGYFDYTSTTPISVSLYADGNLANPYFTFTLPANPTRTEVPMRQRFPAIKLRLFRMVATCTEQFQLWNNPIVESKLCIVGSTYGKVELTV